MPLGDFKFRWPSLSLCYSCYSMCKSLHYFRFLLLFHKYFKYIPMPQGLAGRCLSFSCILSGELEMDYNPRVAEHESWQVSKSTNSIKMYDWYSLIFKFSNQYIYIHMQQDVRCFVTASLPPRNTHCPPVPARAASPSSANKTQKKIAWIALFLAGDWFHGCKQDETRTFVSQICIGRIHDLQMLQKPTRPTPWTTTRTTYGSWVLDLLELLLPFFQSLAPRPDRGSCPQPDTGYDMARHRR
jgi:hypothetical protein